MFEIGNSLREARIRRGLELPELEQRTKIRAKYLRALEDEQFELLPAQTYVRGFLRAYAEALGLDAEVYADEYTSRFVVGGEDRPVRLGRSAGASSRRHRRFERNVVALSLLAIAGVTALVIAAWRFGGSDTAPAPAPPARPAAAHRAAPQSPRAAARRGVHLLVVARRGSSLLEVHAGSARGRLLYHGTLERGQRQRFVSPRLWLNVGTPESLSVTLNGRSVSLGAGAPRVLIVTPKAIRPAGRDA